MNTEKKKITNENPVSLAPLTFSEALAGLVQVKSQPPKSKPKARKRNKKAKKPSK